MVEIPLNEITTSDLTESNPIYRLVLIDMTNAKEKHVSRYEKRIDEISFSWLKNISREQFQSRHGRNRFLKLYGLTEGLEMRIDHAADLLEFMKNPPNYFKIILVYLLDSQHCRMLPDASNRIQYSEGFVNETEKHFRQARWLEINRLEEEDAAKKKEDKCKALEELNEIPIETSIPIREQTLDEARPLETSITIGKEALEQAPSGGTTDEQNLFSVLDMDDVPNEPPFGEILVEQPSDEAPEPPFGELEPFGQSPFDRYEREAAELDQHVDSVLQVTVNAGCFLLLVGSGLIVYQYFYHYWYL